MNLGNLCARKCWQLSILIKIEIYALKHEGIIKLTERKQEIGVKGQEKMKCGNYTQEATTNSKCTHSEKQWQHLSQKKYC